MKDMPFVSVIMPVYNSEEYLCECLDSVLSQTLKNIEVICIDDGSTDSSYDILDSYSMKDERIIVQSQTNLGAAAARNKALSLARGEYIAFMDSDDMYPDNTILEYMYKKAKDNGASVCGGGVSNITFGKIVTSKELGEGFYYSEERFANYYELQIDYGYTRYIFLKSLISDNNIIFPDLLRFQDPPFFVQVMLCAEKIYTLTIDTYLYRKDHKKIAWTYRRVNDVVKGLILELEYCQEYKLDKLQSTVLMRLNKEYYKIIKESILSGNPDVVKLLFNAALWLNSNNNRYNGQILLLEEYLNREYDTKICKPETGALQREITQLKKEINDICNSRSFRIGRILTFIPRKIRGVYRCYKDHGFRYTWNEIVYTMKRKVS